MKSIYFERFPTSTRKFIVIYCTLTRLFQYIGTAGIASKSIFESIFAAYQSGIDKPFYEIADNNGKSEIKFFSPFQSSGFKSVAKYFGWLSDKGILIGNLLYGSQSSGESVIDSIQFIPYYVFSIY